MNRCCKNCEHWYPLASTGGRTGLCVANYRHEQPASMWPCRDYERRIGPTYYVSDDGAKMEFMGNFDDE